MYFAFLHFYNSSTLLLAILGLGPALWSYAVDPDNPLVVIFWSEPKHSKQTHTHAQS